MVKYVPQICCWALVLAAIFPMNSIGGVLFDGIDDALLGNTALSTFITDTEGAMVVRFRPIGTPTADGPECYESGQIIGDADVAVGTYTAIFRHGNFNGGPKLCAMNWDGTGDMADGDYVEGAWATLTWQHTGGNIELYYNGALAASTPSGATQVLTNNLAVGIGITLAGRPVEGEVDEVETYSVALSLGEISAKAQSRVRRLGSTQRSGYWDLSTCGPGASANGVTFTSREGNSGRTLAGDDGANNTGLNCTASTYMTYPGGME